MMSGNERTDDRCRACGRPGLRDLVDLGTSPISTGALHTDRTEARDAPLGRLHLAACATCGHVENRAFDPELIDYDEDYDNSLHFSPAFQRYASSLVTDLVERLELEGAHIVEIGSGRGDFLAEMVSRTGGTATGYDPTYETSEPPPGVRLVCDYFDPSTSIEQFDLLVCRHVLEHLDDPMSVLASLRASAPADAAFYLEVPAAEFNFGPSGMWDCIYPHVSYFSASSLAALVNRSGLRIEQMGRGFDDQFLWVVARPSPDESADGPFDGVEEHLQRLDDFVARWDDVVGRWSDRVSASADGLALWGAGAKGVTFLNAVDPTGRVAVVDLNPRKWERFLPGSGNRVAAPDSLSSGSVSSVLVTNPAYLDEIADMLGDLGVEAEVVAV